MSTPQPSSIEENEIILGTGMGPLRFGATMDEVRTLVGEPEEIDESDDDDDFEHQAWNYHEEDYLLSLYFDREDDFRLSCIETDNPSMRLFGEAIHGQSVDQVKALMQRHNQPTPELETMEEGAVRLSYEKSMIDLYFEDGGTAVRQFRRLHQRRHGSAMAEVERVYPQFSPFGLWISG